MASGVSADIVRTLVCKYRDSLTALGHDPQTVTVIVDDVYRYVQWIQSQGIPYDRVNLDTATSYVAYLRGLQVKQRGVIRPMRSATIRVKASRAKRWYDFLRRRDYIYHNPFDGLDRIRGEKRLPEFLTEQEMESVLSCIRTYRELSLCEMLYATGGRVSEIRGVDLIDLDLEAGRVKLRRKGNRERYMLISPAAGEAIRKYLPERAAVLEKTGRTSERALLVSRFGRRWSDSSLRFYIVQLGVRAGLKKHLHPHMFRHSFATHLLNGKASLKDVQELMDHADLSTTGIYLHLAEGQKEEAHRRAHPRFSGVTPASAPAPAPAPRRSSSSLPPGGA